MYIRKNIYTPSFFSPNTLIEHSGKDAVVGEVGVRKKQALAAFEGMEVSPIHSSRVLLRSRKKWVIILSSTLLFFIKKNNYVWNSTLEHIGFFPLVLIEVELSKSSLSFLLSSNFIMPFIFNLIPFNYLIVIH